MKMVYTNENHFLVSNVQNFIEEQAIKTFIKNEFAQGAVGEVSAFDAWPEVWIYDDEHYDRATEIINHSLSQGKGEDWVCNNCSEKNGSAFEVCWNCNLTTDNE